MGNALLSRGYGRVKLMKPDGQVVKIRAPVTVDDVRKDYPGHVVLHSEEIRHLSVKANPLDGCVHLNRKHLYFVVEIPKLEDYRNRPPRVGSSITMDAKARLENMLLVRRAVSHISVIASSNSKDGSYPSEPGESNRALRLKIRLTKAQVAKMMLESQDGAEISKKLLESCLEAVQSLEKGKEKEDRGKHGNDLSWTHALGSIPEDC